jgi:hypothetical protein
MPWTLKRSEHFKPSVLLTMLKETKILLPQLFAEYKKANPLAESIIEDLFMAVTGYEVDYLTNSSDPEFYITSVNNRSDSMSWTTRENQKINPRLGRVTLAFPRGVAWSLDVYTVENKFYTNRSSYSNHNTFYDLPPGSYNLKLNGAPLEDMHIGAGKEIIVKAGFVSIITNESWALQNAAKNQYYITGNKPAKLALPVGTYNINFEGKDHQFVIKDRLTVKFVKQFKFLDQ